MDRVSRRRWMATVGAGAAAVSAGGTVSGQFGEQRAQATKGLLPLVEYEPKSMLKVPESKVEKPRFPVIDIHTHLSWSPGFSDNAPDVNFIDFMLEVCLFPAAQDPLGVSGFFGA